jgi:hypothetical protein
MQSDSQKGHELDYNKRGPVYTRERMGTWKAAEDSVL